MTFAQSQTGSRSEAISHIGGFLGAGTKYVIVSASALELNDKRMLLCGARKDSLKGLPAFKYAN
jgi:hypothetical protein